MSDFKSQPRILVAGSINTDLVIQVRRAPAAGETVTGQRFDIFGGGKGANQAVAAARAGTSTAMLGAVGRDDFGRQRRRDLEREGIDIEDVADVDGVPSGVAAITVEQGGENRIAYVPGATLSVTPEQAERAVRRVRPVVILATLEIPHKALDALFASGRSMGATLVLNATPEARRARVLATKVDVLVVNETEALELLGRQANEDDWTSTTESLTQLGAPNIVVTLGARGALVRTADQVTQIAAPRVDVVDTTAAGDAFCGAFAARLAGRATLIAAAEFGVIAGSLATTKAGAQPSLPNLNDVERMIARPEG